MDGKGGSERLAGNGRPRKQKSVLDTLKGHKQIVAFLKAQRSLLLAGFLITAIGVLLFGIVGQLQAPATDDVPSSEIPIDYSTFLTQVNSQNVLAVTVNGKGMNVLLQQPIDETTATPKPVALSVTQQTKDVEAWTRFIGSLNTTNWAIQAASFEPGQLVYTTLPMSESDQLMALLVSKHVKVITQAPAQTSAWLDVFLKFVPLLFLLLLVSLVLKPQPRGRIPQNVNEHMAQFTKMRVRRYDRSALSRPHSGQDRQGSRANSVSKKGGALRSALTPSGSVSVKPVRLEAPTTFADVAGIDEVRSELEEMVQFLRSPEKFDRLGARLPRGALLVGPPGTGKTLLAKAVAGEAGVPFFSMSASEFVEMFAGVGASRVRHLFHQARQVAPSVIFIDEIDAVGRKRSVRAMGNDERDQTLNQLLVELDGFHARQAVVVMAATNRVDILDKALLRPGRFDRHIPVSLPDRAGRQAILQIHTAKTLLHEEMSLERLARLTTGMSGADLANLVNEAALCAARKDLERVDSDCFEHALARIQLGALRPLVMSEAERRIIAYHEGGHALVAHYLEEADIVNRVTILPRGQSLGVTQFLAEEDRYNYSREMLMAKIAVGLGGRTAEELTLGRDRVTTGAENDFQVVTSMARRMVTRWGMSEEVGVIFTDYDETGAGLNMRRVDPSAFPLRSQTLVYNTNGYLVPDGEPILARPYAFAMVASTPGFAKRTDMAGLVDREVKRILDEGHAMAQHILQEHSDQLQRLAEALMEREQLSRVEFETLMAE